jgi:hypothetical protein
MDDTLVVEVRMGVVVVGWDIRLHLLLSIH